MPSSTPGPAASGVGATDPEPENAPCHPSTGGDPAANPANAASERGAASIHEEPFGRMADGKEVMLYTLGSGNGLRVSITNYGGAITSIWTPDRKGVLADVVLGYDTLSGYVAGRFYFGALIGRFGNRLNLGRFTLDGVDYTLNANNGPHHLHGGFAGFHKVLWEASPARSGPDPGLILTHLSPDGEEGYPGTLEVEVTYALQSSDTLRIHYRAETNKPTPINLTNHSYFNLAGHAAGDILDHELTLFADLFTPVDATLIPTGELRPVDGTPFDFRQPRRIGERLADDDEQLRLAGGYDHNFVLPAGKSGVLRPGARARDPRSGRVVEMFTTEPGFQFYTGNFLDGSETGKGGAVYQYRGGFCLETQHFPDSPNQPNFPSTILRPGEVFESTTLYRFTVT